MTKVSHWEVFKNSTVGFLCFVPLSSVICRLSSVLCLLSAVFCLLPLIFCRLSSVVRLLLACPALSRGTAPC
ncbi:MAG: hypothetical protein C0610_09155, partial [Desulfobacteraceae bacterium]